MNKSVAADKILAYTLVVLLSIVLVLAAIYSLEWRIGYDTAILLYVARLVDQHGLAPYSQIFFKDLPESLLLNIGIGRLIGYTNDQLLRLLDLSYLTILGIVTYVWLRPLGRRAAWGGGVLFALAYLGSDITVSTQRDYILILPVAVSAVISIQPKWKLWVRTLLIGLLCGLAAGIKPHALIALPVLLLTLMTEIRDEYKSRKLALAATLLIPAGIGLTIPVVLSVGYLFVSGTAGSFIEIATRYVPLYTHINSNLVEVEGATRFWYLTQSVLAFGGHGFWLISATTGAACVLLEKPRQPEKWRLVLQMAVLTACFAIYPAFSGQFFNYHWLPFMYFAACLSALCLQGVPENIVKVPRWIPMPILVVVMILPQAYIPDLLGRMYDRFILGKPIPSIDGGLADEISAYLRAHMTSTDRVQILGSAGAPITGVLNVDALPATRFLLDEPLHHDRSTTFIQSLRQEFFTEMVDTKPRFVIDMFVRSYIQSGDSGTELPEISRLLAAEYQIVYVGNNFAIYEHQPALRNGLVVYPLRPVQIPIRYFPEAAKDVVAITRKGAKARDILIAKLDPFVQDHEIIKAEFLGGEIDPDRVIEGWLNQNTFRIGESWIHTTRSVNYLRGSSECLQEQVEAKSFGENIQLVKGGASLIQYGGRQWICGHLEWTTRIAILQSYKLSVKVLDQSGQLVAQYDTIPGGDLAPTQKWEQGSTVIDQFALLLPDHLSSGLYWVELSVYEETTLSSLKVDGKDSVLLTEIKLHK